MNGRIFKYLLSINADTLAASQNIYSYKVSLDLPRDHRILHLGSQKGEVYVWVLINTDQDSIDNSRQIDFHLVATGVEIEEIGLGTYLETIHLMDDTFIYHVFVDHHPQLEGA